MTTPEFTADAYGRVNLIGEHTDYNGGWVLPTAIPQKTTVKVRRREDRSVVLRTSMPGASEVTYELGFEKPREIWADYLMGVTQLLRDGGYAIGGFDAFVDSAVPVGSGLSSSAALEVSALKALRSLFGLELSDVEIAKLGQKVENEFVGARVGIMDQMACSLAKAGEALYLDTQTLAFERVALPLERMDLIVINSGVAHRNVGGGYNQRRSECEQACAALGIEQLRSLGTDQLSRLCNLDPVLARRARHVITENGRVHDAVTALRTGDLRELGRLFSASHASMRDDYEVSIPEIDELVRLCDAAEGVWGARLTGGGFGGSIVAVAEKGAAPSVIAQVIPEYERRTGQHATVLVPDHIL